MKKELSAGNCPVRQSEVRVAYLSPKSTKIATQKLSNFISLTGRERAIVCCDWNSRYTRCGRVCNRRGNQPVRRAVMKNGNMCTGKDRLPNQITPQATSASFSRRAQIVQMSSTPKESERKLRTCHNVLPKQFYTIFFHP